MNRIAAVVRALRTNSRWPAGSVPSLRPLGPRRRSPPCGCCQSFPHPCPCAASARRRGPGVAVPGSAPPLPVSLGACIMGDAAFLGPAGHGPREGAHPALVLPARVQPSGGTPPSPLPDPAVRGYRPGLLDFVRLARAALHRLRVPKQCAAAVSLAYHALRKATITGAYVFAGDRVAAPAGFAGGSGCS